MPIYEFACPKCRTVYSFLSKRLNPSGTPTCPKCGNKSLEKQVSIFAMPRSAKEPGAESDLSEAPPDFDEARIDRAMSEIERDMGHLDENNPRHMAHVMKKMKEALPAGTMPKEYDMAIKRLEAGEDPDKIEQDLGDIFGDALAAEEGHSRAGGGGGNYSKDPGLYDY